MHLCVGTHMCAHTYTLSLAYTKNGNTVQNVLQNYRIHSPLTGLLLNELYRSISQDTFFQIVCFLSVHKHFVLKKNHPESTRREMSWD